VNRSKSTLLLIEQIIVIAIFAVCAAVCVNIIASSYLITARAVDTRNALSIAERAADTFKARFGDVENTTVHFGEGWMMSGADDAAFVLRLTRNVTERVIFADITMYRVDGDTLDELLSLPVAVRRGLHD